MDITLFISEVLKESSHLQIVPEISNYMDIYSALDFLSALHEQGTDQN
jgi:hypothetical protein